MSPKIEGGRSKISDINYFNINELLNRKENIPQTGRLICVYMKKVNNMYLIMLMT